MHSFSFSNISFLSISLFVFLLGACQNIKNNPKENELQTTIHIKGMMCKNACGAKIKKELSEIAGVDHVSVNFKGIEADNSVLVTYNPKRCSKKDLTKKIEKIGGGTLYQVTHYTDETP